MGEIGMNRDRLSLRQLLVAAFTGGLAPAAAAAGRSWQGTLLALPVLLLAGWGLSVRAPRWARLEGKPAGRALHILYMVWGTALLSRGLTRCAGGWPGWAAPGRASGCGWCCCWRLC